MMLVETTRLSFDLMVLNLSSPFLNLYNTLLQNIDGKLHDSDFHDLTSYFCLKMMKHTIAAPLQE